MNNEKPAKTNLQNEESVENIKLPRGPLFSGFSMFHLVRAAMFASLLAGVLFMRKPCADSTAVFVESFDPKPDPPPLNPLEGYTLVPAEEALKDWPEHGSPAKPNVPSPTKAHPKPAQSTSKHNKHERSQRPSN